MCREGFVRGLYFEKGRILPYIDGRGFAGKGIVAFWGEAGLGKDATRGSKHDSFPEWGRIALHFRGKKV